MHIHTIKIHLCAPNIADWYPVMCKTQDLPIKAMGQIQALQVIFYAHCVEAVSLRHERKFSILKFAPFGQSMVPICKKWFHMISYIAFDHFHAHSLKNRLR